MKKIITGELEYFPSIKSIEFEGPSSDNPLAFRYYNPIQKVGDKTMDEHFKFSMAYWHSLVGNGADPFGEATHHFPWNRGTDPYQRAQQKMDAAFELMTKLGLNYYCFHDLDLIDFTSYDLLENESRLLRIVQYAQKKQLESGIELLWGTANLFSNAKFMNGAATNPDFLVLAHGGAQVKAALDATIELGGHNFVFWGGREGYMSLLNTDMKREKEHLAKFLSMSRDYARKNGFKGNFFIEPKPCEPTKHQYDFDAATVLGFLKEFNLHHDFKLNIEVNHATLAGHTFVHELQVAADSGALGSIDANRGDEQNGWDTDQFPNNASELTEALLVILTSGGLQGGGVNFDAKIRRNSTDPEDLFYAHIGGMDCFAKALLSAQRILDHGEWAKLKKERYASFDVGEGKSFEQGNMTMERVRDYALKTGAPNLTSGRQEYLENLINRFQ